MTKRSYIDNSPGEPHMGQVLTADRVQWNWREALAGRERRLAGRTQWALGYWPGGSDNNPSLTGYKVQTPCTCRSLSPTSQPTFGPITHSSPQRKVGFHGLWHTAGRGFVTYRFKNSHGTQDGAQKKKALRRA